LQSIAQLAAQRGIETINIGSNGWRADSDDGFRVSLGSKDEWYASLSPEAREIWEAESARYARRTTGGPSPRKTHEYRGHHLSRLASEQLDRLSQEGKRFFMWVNLPEPHPPFRPPRELYEKRINSSLGSILSPATDLPHPVMAKLAEEWAHLTNHEWAQLIAAYYGLLELADQFVGNILHTLEEQGLRENTAVIITADHGEMAGEHGMMLKFNLREAAIRIPLVVSDSNVPSATRHDLVEGVDIFAMACELLGIPRPEGIAGRSPLAENPRPKAFVSAQHDNDDMIRTESWKLVRYDDRPGELFCIDTDPEERYNLISRQGSTEKVSELEGLRDSLRRRFA
jgi:arylsulfatase A-like enzyme